MSSLHGKHIGIVCQRSLVLSIYETGVFNMKTLPYQQLAVIFLRTGAQAFGGWSATSLLLEKELVDKRSLLTARQLHGATTYAQVLPGGTQVAIASNVGYQLAGVRGAAIATVSYLAPAVVLMTIFAAVYFHYAQHGNLMQHLGGLTAALSGIIMANAYRIGQRHAARRRLWLLPIASAAGLAILHIHAVIILVVYAVTGFAVSWAGVPKGTRHE